MPIRGTERFRKEITGSHTVVSYADITPPGGTTRRLIITGGEVTVDRTAKVRRSFKASCVDPFGEYIPNGNQGLLTPFGTEVRPYRGVRYSDGTEEIYPLGVFRISESTFKDGGKAGIDISISAFDLSRTVQRDKFVNTYTIDEGTNVITAIKLILGRTFPNLSYDAISTTVTTKGATVYAAKDDPWEKCTELATSAGCEIFFDTTGRVVLAPPTDVDTIPAADWTYLEGKGCTMMDVQRQFKDEPGYNGIIVEGASPGDEKPPVRGEAWDMSPASPTYRYGPYGEVPDFVQDSNVKTVEEAQAMANSLLKGQIGFSQSLSLSALTNPILECGDVIRVKRERMKVDESFVIDGFNVPLGKDGSQSIKLRNKRMM